MSKIILYNNSVENDYLLLQSFTNDVILFNYSNYLTSQEFINDISDLSNVEYFGLLFHFQGRNIIPFFNDSEENVISQDFINILEILKNNNPFHTLDILSCFFNKKYFIDKIKELENELQITIRYSIDQKGNIQNDGNWIMESHNIDIKHLYFTDNIDNWSGILSIDNVITNNNKLDFFSTSGGLSFTDTSNNTYYITENITFNTNVYMRLGTNSIFDGNGYIIDFSGITFTGLFETGGNDISDCPIVKNLGIVNGTSGGNIIRGGQKFFIVENCYTTTNIIGGGICGNISANNGHAIVRNCFTTGLIGENNNGISGGIAGFWAGNNNGIFIAENCYTTGNLVATGCGGILGGGSANGGGPGNIPGRAFVMNCYTLGNKINTTNTGGMCGNEAGRNGGQTRVRNCYSVNPTRLTNGNSSGISNNPMDGNFDVELLEDGNLDLSLNTSITASSNLSLPSLEFFEFTSTGGQWIADTFSTQEYPLLNSFRQIPWDLTTYENYNQLPSFDPKSPTDINLTNLIILDTIDNNELVSIISTIDSNSSTHSYILNNFNNLFDISNNQLKTNSNNISANTYNISITSINSLFRSFTKNFIITVLIDKNQTKAQLLSKGYTIQQLIDYDLTDLKSYGFTVQEFINANITNIEDMIIYGNFNNDDLISNFTLQEMIDSNVPILYKFPLFQNNVISRTQSTFNINRTFYLKKELQKININDNNIYIELIDNDIFDGNNSAIILDDVNIDSSGIFTITGNKPHTIRNIIIYNTNITSPITLIQGNGDNLSLSNVAIKFNTINLNTLSLISPTLNNFNIQFISINVNEFNDDTDTNYTLSNNNKFNAISIVSNTNLNINNIISSLSRIIRNSYIVYNNQTFFI